MTESGLTCVKHHTPTQLTCAQCARPSCTKCLVWTEVGQKCRTCVPDRRRGRRDPRLVPVLVGAAAILVILGLSGVFSGPSKPAIPVSAARGPVDPGIGEAARDGSLTFVVTKFDCGTRDIGDGPMKRTALGHYCVLDFTATNTGTQPTSFSVTGQSLRDALHRRFAPDPMATLASHRGSPGGLTSSLQQLNPGAEIAISLVYDIPDGVTPEVAELRSGNTLGVSVRLTAAVSGPGTT